MAVAQARTESGNKKSHLTVSFTTSNPPISLSALSSDPVFSLTVSVQRTDARPITLCTAGSALDNGHHAHHDGIFRGAFLPLTSISDPTRKIQLHFAGFPNYGSQLNASVNLLERDYLRFESVPSKGEGKLVVTHEISLERLFRYSGLKKEAVKAGEKFIARMNPKRLGSTEGWWTWGSLEGELKGKKFARWERRDRNGEIGNLMPGEKMPDVEGMQREGWVFSEPFHELTLEAAGDEEFLVEFAE